MTPPLETFLSRYKALSEELTDWGQMTLRVTGYLIPDVPPLGFVTSARCVVTKGNSVLAQQDRTRIHIWPGGRLSPGEEPSDAARREVLEETGWAINEPLYLGLLHYRHLTPKPPDYDHPYPDFLQIVYKAEAVRHVPSARLEDGFELGSSFLSVQQARALELSAGERLFLGAALGELNTEDDP